MIHYVFNVGLLHPLLLAGLLGTLAYDYYGSPIIKVVYLVCLFLEMSPLELGDGADRTILIEDANVIPR